MTGRRPPRRTHWAFFLLALAVATCRGGGPATPIVLPPAGFDPTEVLVRLAPGTDIAAVHARYNTRTLQAIEDGRVYLLALPAGITTDDILPSMRADPDLQAASANAVVSIPEAHSRSTMAFADPTIRQFDYTDQEAVRRIRAPESWPTSNGEGVIIAVLDTGLDVGHPALAGRIAGGGADVVDGDLDVADLPDGVDSDGDGQMDEAVGHGTFVAGLALSVAPGARVLPVRLLDSDGIGTAADIAHGIEIAARGGARVINMSFGMAVESAVIQDLVNELSREQGIVFVASAGNADQAVPQYPAAYEQAIAVAAVDPADRRASFSNYGAWVEVAAPGVGLVAPLPAAGYGRWSGTSFSAGLTSGLAAVLVAFRPLAEIDAIHRAIESSAVPISDLLLENVGRIDVRAALDVLDGDAGEDDADDDDADDDDADDDDADDDDAGDDDAGDDDAGDDDDGADDDGADEDPADDAGEDPADDADEDPADGADEDPAADADEDDGS